MLLQEKKQLSIYFENAGAICGNKADMANIDLALRNVILTTNPPKLSPNPKYKSPDL